MDLVEAGTGVMTETAVVEFFCYLSPRPALLHVAREELLAVTGPTLTGTQAERSPASRP